MEQQVAVTQEKNSLFKHTLMNPMVRKLDRITLEAILRTLKTYNLAKPLDRLTEEEAKIEIYPTVILALPDNVLKSSRDETAAALDKYRKAGEEDDV